MLIAEIYFPTIFGEKVYIMRWAWIEHATFRSSVWRSPNWAIPAYMIFFAMGSTVCVATSILLQNRFKKSNPTKASKLALYIALGIAILISYVISMVISR